MYQMPNWGFNEIGDLLGPDHMNRVFLGYSSVEELYNCDIGDANGDGNYNVLDIVTLANCVLAQSCDSYDGNGCALDINSDGVWNVLDIVILANCVLAADCDEI